MPTIEQAKIFRSDMSNEVRKQGQFFEGEQVGSSFVVPSDMSNAGRRNLIMEISPIQRQQGIARNPVFNQTTTTSS